MQLGDQSWREYAPGTPELLPVVIALVHYQAQPGRAADRFEITSVLSEPDFPPAP